MSRLNRTIRIRNSTLPGITGKCLFLLSVLAISALNSCSNHTYAPALYHQDIAYMPKPASFDTAKSATYFSGGLNTYLDPTWTKAMLPSGQVNISQGYVFNHFNLAYGAFGELGDFSKGTSSDDKPDEKWSDKFFGAVGARLSANLFTSYERMDTRFIGFEAAYSHEFGSYSDFRKTVSNLPGYHADTRTDLFSAGLTSEFLFHNIGDVHFQNGLRFFVGETFGNDTFNEKYLTRDDVAPHFGPVYFKVSYFLKIHQLFATIEAGEQVMLRAGVQF
ncbi:MAG: hypothetical protein JST32_12425 [Bacteroidetes bacterium]|nr:hypothetical protein [Bacteroidota bacterium]